MDLYLVRHAIAADRDPGRWPDDGLRPLTPEGEKAFRRAARGLKRLVPSVEIVLASPFVRAWRTAEILTEEAGWPEPVRSEAMEAGRSAADALEALRPHAQAESVAVVGHEPNLSELASLLLARSVHRLSMDVKKGGVIGLLSANGPQPGQSVLRLLLTPKALRAAAP